MIGLLASIFLFLTIAFRTNRNLTRNQIVHIWLFTIAFQSTFDVFVEIKYDGYWYFDKDIEWFDLLPHLFLIPPVNMMFLNWYPFKRSMYVKVFYIFFWVVGILIYESLTLLPQPFGYFNYGWWKLLYAAILDPLLFIFLLLFYKFICKLEKESG
ncbi:MAG: hypothetical protein ACQEWW_09670 [Bacillota bacterium]